MRALTLAVTLATMTAAAADPTLERAQAVLKPLSAQFESMDNPITPAKVALGRALYFEKRLSKNHDLSCNSCHVLSKYGVDNEATSPGHKQQRGERNSPTVYNATEPKALAAGKDTPKADPS